MSGMIGLPSDRALADDEECLRCFPNQNLLSYSFVLGVVCLEVELLSRIMCKSNIEIYYELVIYARRNCIFFFSKALICFNWRSAFLTFRSWIAKYAENQNLFFEDFEKAYTKLVNSGAKWKSLWYYFGDENHYCFKGHLLFLKTRKLRRRIQELLKKHTDRTWPNRWTFCSKTSTWSSLWDVFSWK